MRKNCISLFILVLTISQSIFSQHIILGKILSSKSNTPIAHASVYINSTSNITYTNDNGEFNLTGFLLPCQLVVSHLSYHRKIIIIDKNINEELIYLDESINMLDTITVGIEESGGNKAKLKNKRTQNFKEFSEYFLGNDKWGKAAILEDNGQLKFWHHTDTVFRLPQKLDTVLLRYGKKLGNGYGWTKDSSMVFQYSQNLYANSESTITMKLPMLGYDVSIDLNEFMLGEIDGTVKMSYNYYSYFTPLKDSSSIKIAKIERNRKEVYYNSTKHFFHSLFNHKLYENGYLTAFDVAVYSWMAPQLRKYSSIDSLCVKFSKNIYAITGLKGKKINITYYGGNYNKPMNLTNFFKKGALKIPLAMYNEDDNSYIVFQSDTCMVRTDGIAINNDIVIGGQMGHKATGATLPIDYEPVNTNEKNKQKEN